MFQIKLQIMPTIPKTKEPDPFIQPQVLLSNAFLAVNHVLLDSEEAIRAD